MEDKEINAMNVVPLIDIMLVLLTIVLVTSTFIAAGKIPVELPQAKSAVKMKDNGQEIIEVNSEEEIYFREHKVTFDELEEHLQEIAPTVQIILRADKKVSLDVFVTLIDLLKDGRFENVSLQAGFNR